MDSAELRVSQVQHGCAAMGYIVTQNMETIAALQGFKSPFRKAGL